MSDTQQSSFTILTLAQWMTQHDDELNEIVTALCQVFDLPRAAPVSEYLEDEIEHQARLLLVIEDQTIFALAGWNWAHLDHRAVELPVYLGIRRNLDVEGLRMMLVTSVMTRLREDRFRSGHTHVDTAWLQYHPGDLVLRDLCETMGFKRDKRRNRSFRESLGANGSLRSLTGPIPR